MAAKGKGWVEDVPSMKGRNGIFKVVVKQAHSKTWLIVTHKMPHPDEIVAYWELIRFAYWAKKYPGITKAKIFFTGSGETISPEMARNAIYLGTGHRDYDEHITSRDSDRIDDCAAGMVFVEDTESQEDKSLQRIIEYVRKHDLLGIRKPFDFADAIISLEKNGHSDEEVVQTGVKILDALYQELEINQKHRETTADFVEKWLSKKSEEVTFPIRKLVKTLGNGIKNPLDITEMFAKMTQEYGEKEAKLVIKQMLEAKYNQQKMFNKAVKEVERANIVIVPRKDHTFVVVTGTSDNSEFNKAARAEKSADLVIQQNSNGRVILFTNAKSPIQENFKDIVAAVRLEESIRRGKPVADYGKLTLGGKTPGIDQWYYQPGGNKLMNGSETADAEPTSIALEEIRDIATKVIKLGINFQWKVYLYKRFRSQ